jgi:hypothetical protein
MRERSREAVGLEVVFASLWNVECLCIYGMLSKRFTSLFGSRADYVIVKSKLRPSTRETSSLYRYHMQFSITLLFIQLNCDK